MPTVSGSRIYSKKGPTCLEKYTSLVLKTVLPGSKNRLIWIEKYTYLVRKKISGSKIGLPGSKNIATWFKNIPTWREKYTYLVRKIDPSDSKNRPAWLEK
jgi:hypothetical protein